MKYSYFSLLIATIIFSSNFVFAKSNFSTENSGNISVIPFEPNTTRVISGIDYSSGYYGLKQKTDMLYIPVVLKYHQANWDFSLTFSYIKMTGPGGIFGGGDGGVIPTSGKSNVVNNKAINTNNSGHGNKPDTKRLVTNKGLGDTLFKVTYAADIPLQLPFLLELAGQVKIPTADKEKELGTGEFDWSVSLDLAYAIDSFSPFLTIGYKFMGDPEEVNLDNVYFTSVGVDYAISHNLHSGIIYDYKEKLLSSSYDMSESTLYLNWNVNQNWSVNTYIVKGFASGSPDWASGLQFSFLL